MATNYYKNSHAYFVEAPLTYGGSLSVAPGKYVAGSADTGCTFPRLVSLGILTDAGATSVGDTGSAGYLIGLTPSLLIFSEPQPPLTGATGDTGAAGTAVAKGDTGTASTVKGNTGVTGTAGNTGVGTHGDTGTVGAAGSTGVGTRGDTGTASTVAGDTGVGVRGDTGTAGAKGDTGVAGT